MKIKSVFILFFIFIFCFAIYFVLKPSNPNQHLSNKLKPSNQATIPNSNHIQNSYHKNYSKKSKKLSNRINKKEKIASKSFNEIKFFNQRIREEQNYVRFQEEQLRKFRHQSQLSPEQKDKFNKYIHDIEAHRAMIRFYKNMAMMKKAKEREKIMRQMFIKRKMKEMEKLKENK